jgi:3-deoxy-D-manno-octulosonic-acid transferase
MRIIYSICGYLLAPLLPLYLIKRGKKNPDYLTNWHERFAMNLQNPTDKPIIWLHAVSVGETRAMQQLVALLSQEWPEYQLLITSMTPTGRATAQILYPQAIIHYVPYDLIFCVKKFYSVFKPKLGIIMETEIWPNLIHFARQFNCPLYLVNARLSQKSFRGYQRFKWALLPIINRLSGILCQDAATLTNFNNLGYQGKLVQVGNTKFDMHLAPAMYDKITWFKTIFATTTVITFSSTRIGEEELFLDHLDLALSDVVYLIIPRHPERFDLVEKLLQERNISYQKRSQLTSLNHNTKVVLGDSLGEMLAYYAVSKLAVIGGSFTECGGQNPIEAIFMQVPVIFGPSMYNFSQVASDILANNCGIQLSELAQLPSTLTNLISQPASYQQLYTNCQNFISQYQGASQRIIAEITPALS